MKKHLVLGLSILACLNVSSACLADQCPTILREPDESKALAEMRVKAIKGWDKLFTWALSPKNHPYQLEKPLVQKMYQVKEEDLRNFDLNYGYFSIYHPIVGIVTDSERDIQVTQCLLNSIEDEITDKEQRRFSIDEALTKVMAYRPLKKGMKLSIATSSEKAQTYLVDEVIDLWRGMPAFGLVPEEAGEEPPILLFRGTDLNLTSEKGWASVLSDLDIAGPGYTTFLRGQRAIHDWLEKMHGAGTPARAIGFSLGGVFVYYTAIYEHDLLSKKGVSTAFNPPGVSQQMLERWKEIPAEKKPPQVSYVNQGDFVSQVGFLLSDIWEITLAQPMGVIEAHVTFITTQPLYKMSYVNTELENKGRE